MDTLYLCSYSVQDRNETHPALKKFARKSAQCEVWAASKDQALIVAKQVRESEFPSLKYEHFNITCEAQEGVTIEGNRAAYLAIGRIYEVRSNGQAVIHDKDETTD